MTYFNVITNDVVLIELGSSFQNGSYQIVQKSLNKILLSYDSMILPWEEYPWAEYTFFIPERPMLWEIWRVDPSLGQLQITAQYYSNNV